MKTLTFILLYSIFVSSCLNSSKIEKLLIANDKIVTANEFEMKSYESLPSWSKKYYSKKKYLELVDMHKRDYKKQSFRITYLSDGLKIKAIITVPHNFSPESVYPVVIYNRGNTGSGINVKPPLSRLIDSSLFLFKKISFEKFP
jgi:hypothetical protein